MATEAGSPLAVVVMGVAGCGKTTVGRCLADRLAAPFVEGDDHHPDANRTKMARGEPLTDADRAPWLARVAGAAGAQARRHGMAVTACSALKREYRETLAASAAVPVAFVHLAAPPSVIRARLTRRTGHFMPAALLDSQFAALEPPGTDERALTLDAGVDDAKILAGRAARWLAGDAPRPDPGEPGVSG